MRLDRGADFISNRWAIVWKTVWRRKGNLPKRSDDSKSGSWDEGRIYPVLSQQWSAISVNNLPEYITGDAVSTDDR